MKKTTVILFATVVSLTTSAQKLKEKDLPSAVTTAFKQKFSDAKDVDWEKENGNYEAEFKTGKTEQSVVFDATGKIVETEVEIKENELPIPIREYLSQKYSGEKIKEAARITDANGTITYEAEVKDMDLIFDSNGKFIKEEIEKDDDKD